jgi:carbon monoxide dehydrogenase subunit G
MIQVACQTTISNSPPEAIFAALSDSENLAQLLPRMRRIEILEQWETDARLAAYMAMTESVGTMRCEGDLRWSAPHEIVFTVQSPVTMETRWCLTPVDSGTDLQVMTALDLEPVLGPMAQFVPDDMVRSLVAEEMEKTLVNIARHCAATTTTTASPEIR